VIYKEFWDHKADKLCNIHNYDMSVVLRLFVQEVEDVVSVSFLG
jgi:hypothetical protein